MKSVRLYCKVYLLPEWVWIKCSFTYCCLITVFAFHYVLFLFVMDIDHRTANSTFCHGLLLFLITQTYIRAHLGRVFCLHNKSLDERIFDQWAVSSTSSLKQSTMNYNVLGCDFDDFRRYKSCIVASIYLIHPTHSPRHWLFTRWYGIGCCLLKRCGWCSSEMRWRRRRRWRSCWLWPKMIRSRQMK